MLIINILISGIFLISTQKSLIKKIKDLIITIIIAETKEATSKQVKSSTSCLKTSLHTWYIQKHMENLHNAATVAEVTSKENAQREERHALYATKKTLSQCLPFKETRNKETKE